ncbi:MULTISPECIES: hypothetical protein [Bacillus cereus group]|uniref:hypothetical protein n=1 Tax=Bacillus cereus group TaxID=86661 RepID=UPI00397F9F57
MPIGVQADFINIVPYIGAWIEIPADATSLPTFCVAPHIGAWIEIQTACLFP